MQVFSVLKQYIDRMTLGLHLKMDKTENKLVYVIIAEPCRPPFLNFAGKHIKAEYRS